MVTDETLEVFLEETLCRTRIESIRGNFGVQDGKRWDHPHTFVAVKEDERVRRQREHFIALLSKFFQVQMATESNKLRLRQKAFRHINVWKFDRKHAHE